MYNMGNQTITMSLESYKKFLEDQQRTKTINDRYANLPKREYEENIEVEQVITKTPRKNRTGVLVFILIILAVFIVAAVKNPSEAEGNKMVKDYIVEKVNYVLKSEINNEENDGLKQFGAFLGMAFSSQIIDYVSDIEVSDYILFSTFDCTMEVEEKNRTIVSGVIVFGKIIPLKTDLDLKKLNLK